MSFRTEEDAELLEDGAMSINAAVAWSGISRAKLYQAMAAGRLAYVKDGKRRLVPKRGLRDYLARRLEGGGSG